MLDNSDKFISPKTAIHASPEKNRDLVQALQTRSEEWSKQKRQHSPPILLIFIFSFLITAALLWFFKFSHIVNLSKAVEIVEDLSEVPSKWGNAHIIIKNKSSKVVSASIKVKQFNEEDELISEESNEVRGLVPNVKAMLGFKKEKEVKRLEYSISEVKEDAEYVMGASTLLPELTLKDKELYATLRNPYNNKPIPGIYLYSVFRNSEGEAQFIMPLNFKNQENLIEGGKEISLRYSFGPKEKPSLPEVYPAAGAYCISPDKKLYDRLSLSDIDASSKEKLVESFGLEYKLIRYKDLGELASVSGDLLLKSYAPDSQLLTVPVGEMKEIAFSSNMEKWKFESAYNGLHGQFPTFEEDSWDTTTVTLLPPDTHTRASKEEEAKPAENWALLVRNPADKVLQAEFEILTQKDYKETSKERFILHALQPGKEYFVHGFAPEDIKISLVKAIPELAYQKTSVIDEPSLSKQGDFYLAALHNGTNEVRIIPEFVLLSGENTPLANLQRLSFGLERMQVDARKNLLFQLPESLSSPRILETLNIDNSQFKFLEKIGQKSRLQETKAFKLPIDKNSYAELVELEEFHEGNKLVQSFRNLSPFKLQIVAERIFYNEQKEVLAVESNNIYLAPQADDGEPDGGASEEWNSYYWQETLFDYTQNKLDYDLNYYILYND